MIKDGKIEEIEEIVESDKQSEYDEDGNKLPKKKKYKTKKRFEQGRKKKRE